MNPDNLRNWLSSVTSDLRTRKLLPVLVVLVGAAIAIPLLLSHSGTAVSLPAPAPPPTLTAPTPLASTGTHHRHEPQQNYLTGPSHNPFVAKTTTTITASTTTAASSAATTPVTSPATGSASSGTAGGGSSASGTPTAARTVTVSTPATTKTVARTTTVPANLAYTNYEAEVSLLQTGAANRPTVFHNLSRDQLIPTDDVSFAAFLGVRTDRSSAVFVLPDTTTVTGSGNCAPSATSCTFLTLSPGQSAAVALHPPGGAASTYTLTYVKVTKVASDASTVAIDQAGATDVKQATSYVTQLKSMQYAKYTGLLTIHVGSGAPANR